MTNVATFLNFNNLFGVFFMSSKVSDYDRLSLFNKKMDEVDGLGFSRWASEWRLSRGDANKPTNTKFNGPSRDELRSFVLTFRFFIQQKDICNIDEITAVYNKLPEGMIEKQRFMERKQLYDDFLESDSGFGNEGVSLTNWELIEYLIYGSLAHANEDKAPVVDKWLYYDNRLASLYWTMLTVDLVKVYDFLLFVQDLNKNLLKDGIL